MAHKQKRQRIHVQPGDEVLITLEGVEQYAEIVAVSLFRIKTLEYVPAIKQWVHFTRHGLQVSTLLYRKSAANNAAVTVSSAA